MITVSISTLKNSLSAYLTKVKAGRSILILDRNVPVAEINPLNSRSVADDVRLKSLEARGIVKIGKNVGKRKWKPKPLKLKKPVSLVDAILEERREGW